MKKLAILIAGRVKIFVIVAAELPVIEKGIGVTVRGATWLEPGRQQTAVAEGAVQNSMLRKSEE